MTMLYDTHLEWHNKIPAVVHPVDKTARIQIVTPNSNGKFYDLLRKFHAVTQIPVLLNTRTSIRTGVAIDLSSSAKERAIQLTLGHKSHQIRTPGAGNPRNSLQFF